MKNNDRILFHKIKRNLLIFHLIYFYQVLLNNY